ncbi:MAG TPA: hypothetical protein VIO32_10060 [Candidatus Baltobacteraceae bacterium]
MTPALLCLLIPLAGDCSDYVRDVPAITSIVRNQARYNGRQVSVTGRVSKLDQWTSRGGYVQETFSLCDGGCVRVYMETHSAIHDGQLVTVRGQYYQAYAAGAKTFYNEIEGSEVLLRE